MFRRSKIDKRTADPEILREYEDRRNERWREYLSQYGLGLLLVYGLMNFVVGLMIKDSNPLIVMAMIAVNVVLILMFLGLRAAWAPHGSRAIVAKQLFGTLLVVIVMAFVLLAIEQAIV